MRIKINIIIMVFGLANTILAKANEKDFLFMIQTAIKAPSGHNSQPWKFKLNSDCIEIHPDFERSLPVVDSNNRELYISLGCAAENLCIAASQRSYLSRIEICDNKYIKVHLKKEKDIVPSILYEVIEKRQTNRNVYDGSVIEPDSLAILKNVQMDKNIKSYFIARNDSMFETLRTFVSKGNNIQMSDKAFKEELFTLIRFNGKEEKKYNDGLTFKIMNAPSLPRFISKPIVNSYLKPSKQNKSDLKKMDSSSHLVLLTTKNDSVEEWIYLGCTLQRLFLTTTHLGISLAFMNQPFEVIHLAKEVRDRLQFIDGEYPTLLLRIGYGKQAPYSPRRGVYNN